jgi:hypothetical protein
MDLRGLIGWAVGCGMRYAVCGMRYAVCGMWYAVCGMRGSGIQRLEVDNWKLKA